MRRSPVLLSKEEALEADDDRKNEDCPDVGALLCLLRKKMCECEPCLVNHKRNESEL